MKKRKKYIFSFSLVESILILIFSFKYINNSYSFIMIFNITIIYTNIIFTIIIYKIFLFI